MALKKISDSLRDVNPHTKKKIREYARAQFLEQVKTFYSKLTNGFLLSQFTHGVLPRRNLKGIILFTLKESFRIFSGQGFTMLFSRERYLVVERVMTRLQSTPISLSEIQ